MTDYLEQAKAERERKELSHPLRRVVDYYHLETALHSHHEGLRCAYKGCQGDDSKRVEAMNRVKEMFGK